MASPAGAVRITDLATRPFEPRHYGNCFRPGSAIPLEAKFASAAWEGAVRTRTARNHKGFPGVSSDKISLDCGDAFLPRRRQAEGATPTIFLKARLKDSSDP